jgi:hypothetical protein
MAVMLLFTPAELINLHLQVPVAYDPLVGEAVHMDNILAQVTYYSRLLMLLKVWQQPGGVPRIYVEKLPYAMSYEGSLRTFQKIQNSLICTGGAGAFVGVGQLAVAGFEPKPSNFAKLPLYDGEVKVRLGYWRALVESQIEHTMAAATPQAKAHVIRGNLSTKVLGAMENTSLYTVNFWNDPAQIWVALESLYLKPNQAAHALQKKRTLVMENYQLTKYHTEYVRLCTLAQVDPNAAAQLLQFFDGLNNEATHGGLMNQVADLKERCTQGIPVTVTDVFRRCDALISTDVGSDTYEKDKGKRPWVSRNQESSGSGNGSGNENTSRKDRRNLQAPKNGNGKSPKNPKNKKWVSRTGD